MYEMDWGAYPPGDGRGSAGLVRGLATRGPRGVRYFEFAPDMLDEDGHVRSPMGGDGRVRYRAPGLHNQSSFDIWCRDDSGVEDGLNNWGGR